MALALLGDVGGFPARHWFVRLQLGEREAYLALLLELPRDALRRLYPDAVAVLRLRLAGAEVEWAGAGVDGLAAWRTLHGLLQQPDSEARTVQLAGMLDLDAMFEWTALNSLLQNSDSGDELRLCERRLAAGTSQFVPMGWDYDDLQQAPVRPDRAVRDPLTWAAETPLEHGLLRSPTLRAQYAAKLRALLHGPWSEPNLLAVLQAQYKRLDAMDPPGARRRRWWVHNLRERLLARREVLLGLLMR